MNELCAALAIGDSAESHPDRVLAEKPRRSALRWMSAKRRSCELPLVADQSHAESSALRPAKSYVSHPAS
jgi:hypothetical protein